MRELVLLTSWDFLIEKLNYTATVTVPHTWNVDENVQMHCGSAKYTTKCFFPDKWRGKRIFLNFGAVYHTATIEVNNQIVGEHSGSGYTPFSVDITNAACFEKENTIKVLVDNAPKKEMLPFEKNFDWADDGGLIREVSLLVCEMDAIKSMQITPKIESIHDGLCDGLLKLAINQFSSGATVRGTMTVREYGTKKEMLSSAYNVDSSEIILPFSNWKLWDCDHPNLYELTIQTDNETITQRFGLRKIEIKDKEILLNDQSIYLTGCEWMPGSHPDYGMAEPLEHSIKCLKQLKDSGCHFTRFHWQQDSSLYDWCDENGLLVQEEIPYWGAPKKATAMQTAIAKQQADEMVAAHYNHPSIIFWGVGNELNGYSKDTIAYVDTLVAYFKNQDPTRAVNYVSNTLGHPGKQRKDEASLHGDVAMWNEYLGTWQPCKNIDRRLRLTAQRCGNAPLIITEFGLCEPFFKGGDVRRAEILESKTEIYRQIDSIKGYVWFSLNDYRTHVGEEGEERFKRRVHGSTDCYAIEKPSYHLLTEINKKILDLKK